MRRLVDVPPERLARVFLNIEDIHSLHKELLGSLGKDEKEAIVRIGPVYREFADKLRVYLPFVSGYELAAEELLKWESDPTIGPFLEEQRGSEGLALAALLIQPVQRICRYPLLFSEVLKNTPSSHADYSTLRETLNSLEGLTSWINGEKRKFLNAKRMQEIEGQIEGLPQEIEMAMPGRQHIHEWTLKVSETVENILPVRVLLFNDMIMWAKPLRKANQARYEGHMSFDRGTAIERAGMDVVRVSASHGLSRLFSVSDSMTLEHFLTVLTETVDARKNLFDDIQRRRLKSGQSDKQALLNKIDTLQLSLESAHAIIKDQEEKLVVLGSCIKAIAKAFPTLQLPAGAVDLLSKPPPMAVGVPLLSPRPSSTTPTASPATNRMSPSSNGTGITIRVRSALHGEPIPFVALATEDYLSDDPSELSFAFGDPILIVRDEGEFFLGRPLDGDSFVEKKVDESRICVAIKKGGSYVRSEAGSVERKKGNFLQEIGRAALSRSESKFVKPMARTSSSVDMTASAPVPSSATPSPVVNKKKPRAVTNSIPVLHTPALQNEGVLDHSQMLILRQGWMTKKGGSRRNWKRRFFLLSENSLYYYENDKIAGKKPLGTIQFPDPLVVEKSKVIPGQFTLPTTERLWEFRADTVEEGNEWVKQLEELARSKTRGKSPKSSPRAGSSRGSPRGSPRGREQRSASTSAAVSGAPAAPSGELVHDDVYDL